MRNGDAIISQHVKWPWGEKLLRASIDAPLEPEEFKNTRYVKHRNLINMTLSCGTTYFKFNKEGIAEFDASNYHDAVSLTKFQDCYILEEE